MSTMISLTLDDKTNSRLDQLAQSTSQTKANIAEQAVKMFLDNEAWQIEAIREAVKTADSGDETQFVDNDKVMAWLDSWGTDNEQEPPL